MSEVAQLIEEREADYPGNLEKARDMLEKEIESNAAEVLPLLAQVYFWLGDYATETADKEKYFGQGVDAGKKAVEAAPDSAAAHLWYASNMGNHGMIRGIMSSLFYLGPIETHGKKSRDLDEAYFSAGALRLLGRFYQQAPGWPVGPGDAKKSETCLKRAVELAPNFGFNLTYLADLYLSKGRKDEAKALLDQALAIPEDPRTKIMQQKFRDEAQELQKKL